MIKVNNFVQTRNTHFNVVSLSQLFIVAQLKIFDFYFSTIGQKHHYCNIFIHENIKTKLTKILILFSHII